MNRLTARRLRDGATVNSTYDKLNRLTNIAPPSPEPGTTYGYDNLGRLISSDRGGYSQSFTYDALGRNLTQVSPQGTLTSEWDAAGRRTKLTYPGTGLYLNYDYLLTGEVTKVRENGATTGIGVLVTYGYDDLGERTSATYGNGASQAFGYDTVSRLSSLTVNLSGTTNDLTKTFSYNPANQIVIETRSNTAYAQALANSSQTTTTNGLNELATVNSTSAGYDARGNMTADPVTGKSYTYWVTDNQLHTVGSPSTTLSYDALSRLRSIDSGATTTNYVSDGADQVAEYDGSGVLQKRYAFDPLGTPLVAYNSSGNRSWMLADERGSVVALANDSAVMTVINTYDEYGIPGASNAGAFQYAGMRWLSGAGVYAPTFRAYGAHLGRFNQTDPLGLSGDGPNLYAYVLDDPVNLVDPLGLAETPGLGGTDHPDCIGDNCNVIVTGHLGIQLVIAWELPRNMRPERSVVSLPAESQCPLASTYTNFFSQNYVPALGVALKWDTNVVFLLGLSAHKFGYGTSRIYREQRNPLGMIPGGDSTSGLSYQSLGQAWNSWGSMFGASIQSSQTADAFVSGLLSAGYNSENEDTGGDPGWSAGVLGSISGVKQRLPKWASHPECQ